MTDECNKCKNEMKLLREEVISDTEYRILICEKCKTQIARTEHWNVIHQREKWKTIVG